MKCWRKAILSDWTLIFAFSPFMEGVGLCTGYECENMWISPDLWIGCHLHFHSCQPRWPQFLYLENVNDKSYPFSAKSMLRINCIGLKSTRKTQEEPVYSNQVASCGSISYKWRIVLSNGAYVPNAMFSYFPSPSIRDKDKPKGMLQRDLSTSNQYLILKRIISCARV